MSFLSNVTSGIGRCFNKIGSGIRHLGKNIGEGFCQGLAGGSMVGGAGLLVILPELISYDLFMLLFISSLPGLIFLGIINGTILSLPLVGAAVGMVSGVVYGVGKSVVEYCDYLITKPSHHHNYDHYLQSESSIVKIQALFRGHRQRKTQPLSELKEHRARDVRQQADQKIQMLEKDGKQATSLKYAMSASMWHKAIQILRDKPEKVMQARSGMKYTY